MQDRGRQHSRSLTVPGSSNPASILTEFYREEFLKHRKCLQQHREYYSERAITQVDQALGRILDRLGHLCSCEDADVVVSRLLRKIDVVTGLSSWSDSKNVH